VSYTYCNRCAHRNPPQAAFCSVCGAVLDSATDRTITLTRVDALQDSPGHADDVVFHTSEVPIGGAVLVSRTGEQYGDRFPLGIGTTNIGRHPNSDIVLDDITVSRRHAQVVFSDGAYVVRDVGSLNGTYVNQQRTDEMRLYHGDEMQVGKFRLVFFDRSE
jgi:pSer/pThr/pTyr-binding forkhead associated (FHA) protein